jgi:RNA polymerase sigma factor (sigma-70 family)
MTHASRSDHRWLWDALGRLPARQRAAIILRYYEDLAYGDISEILNCQVATARSLVLRGLRRLNVIIEPDREQKG